MARRCTPIRRPRPPSGAMLLGLLIVLALAGVALMAAVDLWTTTRQREREQQLLWAGSQYRDAIRRYWFAAPSGSPRVLPKDLAALLEDVRYPKPLRHLRRLYPDPITGTPEWGVVRDGDGIAGVYSLSDASPIKQAGFVPAYENFNGRSSYRDWVFAFTVPRRAPLLPAPAPGTVLPVSPPSKSLPVRGKPP